MVSFRESHSCRECRSCLDFRAAAGDINSLKVSCFGAGAETGGDEEGCVLLRLRGAIDSGEGC